MSDIVAVPTSITLFAGVTDKSPCDAPVRIASAADYASSFGGAASHLPQSIALFFANGGSDAYVLSVAPNVDGFRRALAALNDLPDVALLAMPDSVLLDDADRAALVNETLAACAALDRCFFIIDLPDGDLDPVIATFRASTTTTHGSYGATYAPWLATADGLVPPSGAVAGVYASVDANSGVFEAPAGSAASISGITGPSQTITNAQQSRMNVDAATGISVNAIRAFPNQGTVVWGARTIDGNSNDWRYVSVRRLGIMIAQSMRLTLQSFVFSPNDATTWATINGMASSFMTGLWRDGGLQGSTPRDAFNVQIGLGSTMTQEDIDNGIMRMNVMFAPVRPAEFVVLSFTQAMQAP